MLRQVMGIPPISGWAASIWDNGQMANDHIIAAAGAVSTDWDIVAWRRRGRIGTPSMRRDAMNGLRFRVAAAAISRPPCATD
jgi:hypothetical protein